MGVSSRSQSCSCGLGWTTQGWDRDLLAYSVGGVGLLTGRDDLWRLRDYTESARGVITRHTDDLGDVARVRFGYND